MKKILIAAIALMTVLTMSLTSCESEPTPNEAGNGLDDDIISRDDESNENEDDSSNGENNETPNNSEDENNNNNTQTPVGVWTAASGTVYVRTKAHIRESASKTSESAGIVEMGTALTRTETNGTWDKVTYNGNTAYILSDLVTTSQSRVTFEDKTAENKTLHLKEDTKSNLRTSPVASDHVNNLAGTIGSEHTNSGTLKLVKLSKDGYWAQVSFTGTAEGGKTFHGTEVLYIATTYIQELNPSTNPDNIPG